MVGSGFRPLHGSPLLTWEQHKPESREVVASARPAPNSIGRSREPGGVAPAPAADHPHRAILVMSPSPAVVRCAIVIIVPVVLHSFPYTAVHVVKAEAVGLLFPHRMELVARIFIIPPNPLQIRFPTYQKSLMHNIAGIGSAPLFVQSTYKHNAISEENKPVSSLKS